MADEDHESSDDDRRELLLEQYRIRSEEISEYIQRQNKQTSRAIVAIAVILAAVYANPSSNGSQPEWLLIFVPVVLGLLVIEWTRTIKFILWSAEHKIRIEDRLSPIEDLFNWERKRGGALGTEKDDWSIKDVSWQRISLSFLVSALYSIFLVAGIDSWDKAPETIRIIDDCGVKLFFLAFTLLLLISVGDVIRLQQRILRRIKADDG